MSHARGNISSGGTKLSSHPEKFLVAPKAWWLCTCRSEKPISHHLLVWELCARITPGKDQRKWKVSISYVQERWKRKAILQTWLPREADSWMRVYTSCEFWHWFHSNEKSQVWHPWPHQPSPVSALCPLALPALLSQNTAGDGERTQTFLYSIWFLQNAKQL